MTRPKNAETATLNRRDTLGLLGALSIMSVTRRGFAASTPKKLGFVGAGRMGSAIGTLCVHAGHEVMFSSRHPEELKSLVDGLGSQAHAGTVAEAIQFGEIIVLTLPYTAMPDLARDYGTMLASKPLILDVGNLIARRDSALGPTAVSEGAGLYAKQLLPGAKIVRAFNALNWAKIPEYATHTGKDIVACPIVGDDKSAITLAERLIREIHFEPVLVGGLDMSAAIAPGGPLADAHSPAEIRQLAAGLKHP